MATFVNASSGTDEIMRQSAAYRSKLQSYNHINAEDYKRNEAPIAAQEAILEALGRTYEHPVNSFIERQLSSEY